MPCWLASGELDCVFLEDYKEKPFGIAHSCTPIGKATILDFPPHREAQMLCLLILRGYQAKFLDGSYRNPMQSGTLSVSQLFDFTPA